MARKNRQRGSHQQHTNPSDKLSMASIPKKEMDININKESNDKKQQRKDYPLMKIDASHLISSCGPLSLPTNSTLNTNRVTFENDNVLASVYGSLNKTHLTKRCVNQSLDPFNTQNLFESLMQSIDILGGSEHGHVFSDLESLTSDLDIDSEPDSISDLEINEKALGAPQITINSECSNKNKSGLNKRNSNHHFINSLATIIN